MKKLFALLLVCCVLVMPLSVSAASTATQDGLNVTIATDKPVVLSVNKRKV